MAGLQGCPGSLYDDDSCNTQVGFHWLKKYLLNRCRPPRTDFFHASAVYLHPSLLSMAWSVVVLIHPYVDLLNPFTGRPRPYRTDSMFMNNHKSHVPVENQKRQNSMNLESNEALLILQSIHFRIRLRHHYVIMTSFSYEKLGLLY